jgi:hypothetical protein
MNKTSKLTKEQAIDLYDSNFWETMSYRERAIFQMNEPRLCMPFDVFHEAMEKTLERSIFTHEFGFNYDGLLKELMNGAPAPSFEDIIGLIPEEKRIVLVV